MDVLTIDQVLAYAKPIILSQINYHAGDCPKEHREEMVQSAYMRLWKAFPTYDQDQGWKSFTYKHAQGAVLDYLKFGKGFAETKHSLAVNKNPTKTPKLRVRMDTLDTETGTPLSIDQILGNHGVFSETNLDPININWELLARLASQDEYLHAFARLLLGQTIEAMAPVFGVVRTRVSQMIQMFVERFDDPELADDPYFKQVCFALGICRQLGMPNVDQSEVMGGMAMGWKLDPVDLDSMKPHQYILEQVSQIGFFDDKEESQGKGKGKARKAN